MKKEKDNLIKKLPKNVKEIEKKSKQEEKVNSKGNKRGISKASLSNLTPGGPGRPKGRLDFNTRVDMAIEVLAMKYVKDYNAKKENKNRQITLDDVDIEGDIFAQFLNKARNGDMKAIDSFLDRRNGKATISVELTGKGGGPVSYAMKMAEVDAETDAWFDTWVKEKEILDSKEDDKETGPEN